MIFFQNLCVKFVIASIRMNAKQSIMHAVRFLSALSPREICLNFSTFLKIYPHNA